MRRARSKAASLITTLLVIVVLSTIVLAFLQSMSIDRLSANSAKSMLQAELAARAGLHSAIAQILAAITTNNAFVTGSTNYAAGDGPLVTIGQRDLVDPIQLMPLVSTPPELLTNFLQPGWTESLTSLFSMLAETNTTNTTDLNGRSRVIQSTSNTRLYRAPWVVISGSAGERVGRFAYRVLDENSRLNPLLHTGSGTMANPTNWYGGPADIGLTNVSASILTPAEHAAILAASGQLLTPDSLAQAFGTRADYDRVRHFLTLQTNETYDVIPASFEEGGAPKYNINELATNSLYGATAEARANRIAGIVSSNLSSFAGRDPSLRGVPADEMQYLRRLAAGVVDYIDPDSMPTVVNGGEPAGRDLFPLVAAVAERFRRVSLDTIAASTTIESQCFVQVWNPYTTEITLSNQSLRFVVRNRMKLLFGTGIVTPFEDYDQTIVTNAVIRPNEFFVLEFPTTSQTWTSPGPVNDPPKWEEGPSGNADETTHCPFEFSIDGRIVDMSRRPPVGPDVAISGMVRFGLTFTDATNRWQSSFIPTQNSPPNWRFVGDSRGTYLCNYDWQSLGTSGYTSGSRWKGRQQNASPRHQEFNAHWVQRDYVRDNPSLGSPPASVEQTPAEVSSPYGPNDATAAPAFLGNQAMRSLGELGHIFDPAQAADNLSAPLSSVPPINNKICGGGRTLRIGQPEFRSGTTDSWDTNGRRAIELLDLFTVNSTNSGSEGFPAALGRINPNTTAPEVLAAVLSGIQVTSDRGVPDSTLKDTAALAESILSNRPYSVLSDLHKVMADFATAASYAPAFAPSVGGGTTNLAAADRVREEAFGKLVQHLTVQSRTYRVIAVGESFDPAGKAHGRATLEAIVFLHNKPGGGVRPVIVFQRTL